MKKETKHNCATDMHFDNNKGKCLTNDHHKDIKKHCASGMEYSDQKGRCVIPENIDTDYPESANISSSNLEFTVKKKVNIDDRK